MIKSIWRWSGLLCLVMLPGICASALDICPQLVGDGTEDSVLVIFETFDTTHLPLLANPDSLKILRFAPDGVCCDSLGENSSAVANPRPGSYEVHFKSTNGQGDKGRYLVRVYAYRGGAIRGAAAGGYYVKKGNWDDLDSTLSAARAILDTLNNGFASQINQSNLDTTISSRSTLKASDNIGLNWQDIINSSAIQILQNTSIAGVLGSVAVDTERIARAVWDDDLVAPESREVDLAGCGAGSGAWPCSLLVMNAADSAPIQGVMLRVMNESQSSTEALGLTNSAGLAVCALDEAIYKIWAYKTGLVVDSLPVTVAVSAPSCVDTLWGVDFDPGQPVAPELCRVYGWALDPSGHGIAGATVTARLDTSPVTYQGSLISPCYRSAVTDSVGYWYLDLLPNARLDPDGSKYEFVIFDLAGKIGRCKAVVPDQTGWQIEW